MVRFLSRGRRQRVSGGRYTRSTEVQWRCSTRGEDEYFISCRSRLHDKSKINHVCCVVIFTKFFEVPLRTLVKAQGSTYTVTGDDDDDGKR